MQSEWKRELKIYVCDLYYWFEVYLSGQGEKFALFVNMPRRILLNH